MDLKELQARVRRSHDLHFGHTELPERIRDLQHQIAELAYHRDSDHLGHELGDAAWAILRRPSRECSGNFYIDEDVLRQEGTTDLGPYAIDPTAELLPDFFL